MNFTLFALENHNQNRNLFFTKTLANAIYLTCEFFVWYSCCLTRNRQKNCWRTENLGSYVCNIFKAWQNKSFKNMESDSSKKNNCCSELQCIFIKVFTTFCIFKGVDGQPKLPWLLCKRLVIEIGRPNKGTFNVTTFR